jgi:prolyl 4-hydroxylase
MSVDSALDLLRSGSPASLSPAVEALKAAAKDGSPEAARHLATLAAAGIGVPQSWAGALSHLFTAALAGSESARGQLKVLSGNPKLAAGDDGAPNYWRRLCASVHIPEWLAPCAKQVLNTSPRTVAIMGFIAPPVCDWLIGRAAGRLQPALTYGRDGAATLAPEGRSNSALELGIADSDVVVLLTRQRIAATIGVPVAALETSQILHYATGERFARHHDWLDPSLPEVAARGQRMVTFLIYLNDAFEGGETEFPHLDLRHRGRTGDALYFANVDAAGAPDPRALHAGLPPTRGEKWVFSQWVRDQARV